MASSIPSFLFGAGTKYKTQEELDRAREQVRDMLGDIGHSKFTGWGSALADIGKGISAGIEQRRIGEGQEGLEAAQGPFSQTLAEIAAGYGGADPDAIVATSGTDTVAGGVGTDPVSQAVAARSGAEPVAQALAPSGGGGGDGYLRYANQGATRNKPLAPKLEKALSFLGDLGVTAEVFSGGQDASGPHRTGSHRHDYGNAGDIRFYKDGRQLSWANKADLPLFQEIVRRGKAAGITGFGAGPGYMGEGTMHVGFGTPSVWGAGGRSRNAPGWLTDAYSGRLVGGGGASGQAGGAGTDPMVTGSTTPPPQPGTAFRNAPITDAGLRTPAGADFLSRMGNPAPMAQQQLPMVPPVPQRRMVNPASMSGGPQPLPMVPGRSGGPMPSLQQPVPPPPPAPTPAPAPPQPAPAPPAPPPQVDPFTDMILGDKAGQFKPGNYIPPAPIGKQVFPAAPPAPGTPAAAGFGVPPVVGGGGAERLTGQGTFPPAPAPPQAQQRGGGPQNVIGKLMTILASPYASDDQKRMATAMLGREYDLEDERRKAASPEAQLDLQYKQAMIDNARNKNVAKPMTAEERKFWGIPDSDTRPYMMTEAGPSLIGGAGQTINIGDTPDGRKAAIASAGGDPTDPKWQTYIATGQGTPGKAGGVTATDRNAMRKAESELPALTSTIDALKTARELNKIAYEGFGAGIGGKIGTEFKDWIPDRMQDPAVAQATEQMMQTLSQGAVEQMAATLAGATTQGELDRFVSILANPNTSRSLREQTINRMIELAEMQAATRRDQIDEIREAGDMKPRRTDSGAGGADEGGWTVMPNGTKVRKKGP